MTHPLIRPTSTLLLALLTANASAQIWTQLTPTPYPSTLARRAGGSAFDLVQGKWLIYGGLQSGPTLTLNDTWTFDGASWAQLTPTTTPPPRWGHRMVLDTRRGRIVTFGGRSPTTTATANDTWEWNGSDWQQIITPTSPSARAFYSIAYDERRGKVVIYGNQSGFAPSGGDQTWEYDGTVGDWAQITTATTPPGLETPAMTYDQGRGVTVMFGGWNGSSPGTMYDTTWEYDGVDWVARSLPNPQPTPRYRANCTYDLARGRVLLYGGFGNATALQDTWEYDGNVWTQVLAGGPSRSTEAYFDYNPALNQTVFFGGSGPGGSANETWLYDGPTTAIAAPFGQGCPTSAGTPTLLPTTTPILGTSYLLDISNGTFSGAAIITHGFSNTTSAFGNLPFDLSGFGLTGCRLEIDPAFSLFLGVAGGSATNTFNVPNSIGLTNVQFYSQAAVLDAAAPNGIAGVTNAVHAVIGS